MAGGDFLELLESLLDCDNEEPGDDVEPVDAEEALKEAEAWQVYQFLVINSTSIACIYTTKAFILFCLLAINRSSSG